jgi:UDP-N-acetylglucosamine 2-epimerase (non-hydrolysing)
MMVHQGIRIKAGGVRIGSPVTASPVTAPPATAPLVDIIAGSRLNLMKIVPIILAIQARQAQGSRLRFRLVHTGLHGDERLSGGAFNQLGIAQPDVDLAVGPGTQAEQTAAILTRYAQLLLQAPSSLCLVVGDVTSSMACAIAARKLGVPVAHVEAGIRCGDWRIPEEINRMVTDAISNWFFTTSEVANTNLRRTGVSDDRIFFVGNTMVDSLLANLDRMRPPAFWADAGLALRRYFVMTLNRTGPGDDLAGLAGLLQAVGAAVRGLPVVFPVHPRVAMTLAALPDKPAGLLLVDPPTELEFNHLVRHAKGVITDSGGMTEETTVLGVPCLTLGDSTERPETVTVGTNELIGTHPAALKPALDRLFAGQWKRGSTPEKWDGHTGKRIAEQLERLLGG